MKFEPVSLKDAWVITLDPILDDRGHFARTFCADELRQHGIEFRVVQCNVSSNNSAGTLRGMHYQKLPWSEAKLVRCTQGSIYDVIVDFRPESPTYLQHFGVKLSSENMKTLYVPRGFMHGFVTLEDQTEIFYMMDEVYSAEYACGLRYDDPLLAIDWPVPVRVISEKDCDWPLLGALD